MIETLLHLNYLGRVTLLVNFEKKRDYSLHIKVQNSIERRMFREIDGHERERLAAYLITVERMYLFHEKMETGKTFEEIRWDESYLQLVQFIETLIPGYIFKWDYLKKENLEKNETNWVSTYTAYQINYNQIKEKKPVFILYHTLENEEVKQNIEWIVPREELIKYNRPLNGFIEKIKEDEILWYKQEIKPDLPHLFEGFEDIL